MDNAENMDPFEEFEGHIYGILALMTTPPSINKSDAADTINAIRSYLFKRGPLQQIDARYQELARHMKSLVDDNDHRVNNQMDEVYVMEKKFNEITNEDLATWPANRQDGGARRAKRSRKTAKHTKKYIRRRYRGTKRAKRTTRSYRA
jgi:hypothetical protein